MPVSHSSILYALAGIAFFIFGMTLASENLQKLAANRIRDLLARLSNRPHLGIAVGIALTLLLQSSGAVTSMLVGLGTAGVVTLSQVMSVILGATVGTTFTVQLISLDITRYGLPLFTVAFLAQFMTRKQKRLKMILSVFMGFGLIFWGLEMIGMATEALKNTNVFVSFLDHLRMYPVLTLAVTAIFTAVVHSSAVTIGFAMTLAASGMITLTDALYWVYGANIGTTATALIASMGGNYIGRQVAWAHCFYKLASVLLFYFFTAPIAELLTTASPARDIANFHTVFNVLAAVVFYMFIDLGVRFVQAVIKPTDAEKEFAVKYLDRRAYQSMSVALAHAEREIFRMSDMVYAMVRDSIRLLRSQNLELEEAIKEKDKRVDHLHKEISMFLAQLMEEAPVEYQRQMMQMLNFCADIESVGDVIDNNILELARKKHALKLEFSAEGWHELEEIHKIVLELTSLSISCFQRKDKDLAAKVIYLKRAVRKAEKQLRESHISRLVKGKPESIRTSSIHLDTLSEYRRIAGLMTNHAYNFLKESDKYNIFPRRGASG